MYRQTITGLSLIVVSLFCSVATAETPNYLWVDVTLNLSPLGPALIVHEQGGQKIWVPSELLQSWGLARPSVRVIRDIDDTEFMALHARQDLEIVLDIEASKLSLRMDARNRPTQHFGHRADRRAKQIQRHSGAHLNYDALLRRMEVNKRIEPSVYLQPTLYGKAGSLQSGFRWDRAAGTPWIRLDSQWSMDFVEPAIRLTVGDVISAPDSFGTRQRVGGIRIHREFSIHPNEPQFNTPSFYGISELPSNIELFINGVRQAQIQTDSGPFAIEHTPTVTGAGNAQLILRNVLGEELVQEIAYYVDPSLLRPGVLDFDFSIGSQRQGFGVENFHYGAAFSNLKVRLGLKDNATFEGIAALGPRTANAELGFRFQPSNWPLTANTSFGFFRSDTGILHPLAHFGFNASWGPFVMGTDSILVDLRDETPELPLNRQLIGRVGWRHDRWTVSYDFLNRLSPRNGDFRRQQIRASRSMRLATGHLALSASVFQSEDDLSASQNGLQLNLTWTPNRNTQWSVLHRQDKENRLVGSFLRYPTDDIGNRYLLQNERLSESNRWFGEWQYNGSWIQLRSRAVESDSASDFINVGVSGTTGRLGGRWFASRTLGSSYALIDLNGQSDIPVYLDHRMVARSDGRGIAIVPALRPYQINRISTDPRDFALSVIVDSSGADILPAANSGVAAKLLLRESSGFQLRLMLSPLSAVPSGAVIYADASPHRYFVGDDGEAYLEISGTQQRYTAYWGQQSCEFTIAHNKLGADFMPHIGNVPCH